MTLRRHGLAQRRKDVGSQALQISIDHLARLLSEGQQEKTGNESPVGDTGESTTPSRPSVPLNGFPVSRKKCVDPDVDMVAMQSFRAADKKVGGGHLYGTVVNYLHTQLAPRLFEVGHGTDARRVFTSAASLTELAGWMAHDAGNGATVQQHFVRSLDLAKVGKDRQLAAHICASMSHLANHRRRPHRAIQTRLMDAEKALSAPIDAHEPSPWVSPFDEGSFAHEAARCMRALGHFGQAWQQAQRVLELRSSDRTRSRAFGQLILAAVLLAQGEADHACVLAQEVLDATQSLGSYVVLQQIVELKELLAPHRKNTAVGDFLACCDQVLRERLCLYRGLPEDERGRSTDGVEGM